MWTKVLWKVATCNCHVQLKSHQAIKSSQKTQQNPTPNTENELKVSQEGKTRPHSKVNSHFPFYCSVCFLHISHSLAISLPHSRDPSAKFMRCVLHYFDFLQFRAKRTRTFIFLYGRKKIVQIFFSHFYDTTSSRSENMIFLAIMTSCKP